MSRCFVIAEGGVNHNGSPERALRMVETAAAAGADVVKFQTFEAGRLIAAAAPMAEYQLRNTGRSRSQLEMVRELELPVQALPELKQAAEALGIEFLSTPFDEASLDLLLKLGIRRIKLSSGDLTHHDYLYTVASQGLPVILSTGMATLPEIEAALGALALGFLKLPRGSNAAREAYASDQGKAALRANLTILHCTTEYPAPLETINLHAMQTLREAFGLPVGYSDHSLGLTVPIAAVAMGAMLIEKHFTLDRDLPGPDHKASLDPAGLSAMITGIRETETALGHARKEPAPAELRNRAVARRSLVALRPVRSGETFSADNLGCKRPGTGVGAERLWDYLGRKAQRDYAADELIDE